MPTANVLNALPILDEYEAPSPRKMFASDPHAGVGGVASFPQKLAMPRAAVADLPTRLRSNGEIGAVA